MPHAAPPSFGITTAPMQVGYEDILRVWREADAVQEIGHAWLFDHLMPIGGDPNGPIFEGWTLLSALAAQTERLRLGLLVTSNRFRPPAMLAKIAATVDIVSGGRLDFGIGAGSRPSIPWARREYEANGLPYHDFRRSVEEPRRRLHGHQAAVDRRPAVRLPRRPPPTSPGRSATPSRYSTRTRRSSSPAARPPCSAWPPSTRTCGTSRAVTSRMRHSAARCLTATAPRRAATPRPSRARSTCPCHTTSPVSPATAIGEALDAGFRHVTLGLPAQPYPAGVARWVADELIVPSA